MINNQLIDAGCLDNASPCQNVGSVPGFHSIPSSSEHVMQPSIKPRAMKWNSNLSRTLHLKAKCEFTPKFCLKRTNELELQLQPTNKFQIQGQNPIEKALQIQIQIQIDERTQTLIGIQIQLQNVTSETNLDLKSNSNANDLNPANKSKF